MSQPGLTQAELYQALVAFRSTFGTPAAHFRDPRLFMRWRAPSVNIKLMDVAGTETSMVNALGPTEIGIRGAADDTNWSANTYKTLVTLTGPGIIQGCIGPTGLIGTPTTTWRFTVDGVQTTVADTHDTTGRRTVLGPGFTSSTAGAYYTTALLAMKGADSFAATKDVQVFTTYNLDIPTHQHVALFGMPCLYFGSSCTVEAKCSEANSTTAAVERQSGVLYRLMP